MSDRYAGVGAKARKKASTIRGAAVMSKTWMWLSPSARAGIVLSTL
jgi:hypothetical protein